jgi:type II secretion system protein C
MAKAKVKKKISTRAAQSVETQIVEMSFQHPGLGACRLVPLVKKKRICASAATIQNILRRRGLQNREKRLAKLQAQSKKELTPKSQTKKRSIRISDTATQRIVEISLQNPDLGARRLVPLLQKQGVSASCSTVYRILKRNNLENRQKRILRIKAQQVQEPPPEPETESPESFAEPSEIAPVTAEAEMPQLALEPAAAVPISAENLAPSPSDMPVPALKTAAVAPAVRERQPLRKAPAKPVKRRSHPAFYPLYMLLFVLIGYLGFHGFQAIQYVRPETRSVSASGLAASFITAKVESAASERPLDGYRRIWERNLFNIARAGDSESVKQIAIEKVALAEKGLGLKLVGTVVSNDAKLRRAIIDNSKTRRQKAYREGDAAGGVRIKKILRNRVIVGTAEGDRLLMVDIGGGTEGGPSALLSSASYAQHIPVGVQYPQQIAGRRRPGRSIKLAREEVVASLADIDKLEQQLNIEPFMKDDQPAGFTIGKIPPESILRKMGLKTGNAIMGVNDEVITSPEQAAEFFQTLAQGGEKTIKARIGRGVRSRTRYFHLIIE